MQNANINVLAKRITMYREKLDKAIRDHKELVRECSIKDGWNPEYFDFLDSNPEVGAIPPPKYMSEVRRAKRDAEKERYANGEFDSRNVINK